MVKSCCSLVYSGFCVGYGDVYAGVGEGNAGKIIGIFFFYFSFVLLVSFPC